MKTILTNLGFVFPGQGSQSIGMLAELATDFPQVKQTFDQASSLYGEDLWEITQQGPEQKLNDTRVTQPAMLAAGVAVWRVWESQVSFQPAVMAGHSLGEYTALVCSGKLDYEDAIKLVIERAQQMQSAVPVGEGAMAAILGLDNDIVNQACQLASAKGIVEPVNFNAPGQVVIAGVTDAVNQALEEAKQLGAKRALLLPVSVPSHCALMRPAADALTSMLENTVLVDTSIAVVQNTDATAHVDAQQIRDHLEQQLYKPVLWVESITQMHHLGVTRFVECGPGKVLSGLIKRIIKGVDTVSVYSPDSLASAQLLLEK
ncbi:MAG TPA: [acyl-carrier-protein] S-malonyltransferase [Crenotrichaceae bacterium]|nr:[acyl-carrier-protein] S-malonyltransferase [Crenotrichaceae bacterium]